MTFDPEMSSSSTSLSAYQKFHRQFKLPPSPSSRSGHRYLWMRWLVWCWNARWRLHVHLLLPALTEIYDTLAELFIRENKNMEETEVKNCESFFQLHLMKNFFFSLFVLVWFRTTCLAKQPLFIGTCNESCYRPNQMHCFSRQHEVLDIFQVLEMLDLWGQKEQWI